MRCQLIPVSDDELVRLATERGPDSHEADMLDDLRGRRAKDEQVVAYRLGEFLMVGPVPSAEEELRFVRAYEATKHLKSKQAGDRFGLLSGHSTNS